eukprot:gene3811-4204_t
MHRAELLICVAASLLAPCRGAAAPGGLLCTIPACPDPTGRLAWHPDGTKVSIACGADPVQEFDVAGCNPTPLMALSNSGKSVKTVHYNPAGTLLALGLKDGRVRIYDHATGAATGVVFSQHEIGDDGITGAWWAPDGSDRILSCALGFSKWLYIWTASTGAVIHNLSPGHTYGMLSPRAACSTGTASPVLPHYDMAHNTVNVWSCAWDGTGTRAISGGYDTGNPGRAIVWNTATGASIRRYDHNSMCYTG